MAFSVQPWVRDRDYFGEDYTGWMILYSRSAANCALADSNFITCCKALGLDPDDDSKDTPTRKVVRASHWMCGYIEWAGFHKSDSDAMDIASAIIADLNQYPVLDEDLYSSLKDEYGEDEDEDDVEEE